MVFIDFIDISLIPKFIIQEGEIGLKCDEINVSKIYSNDLFSSTHSTFKTMECDET